MRKQLAEYFEMPRSERIGAIVLLFLSLIFLALPTFLRPFLAPRLVADSAFAAWAAAEKSTFAEREKVEKTTSEPFRFDPNLADVEDFVALGLDEKLANRILNYRDKGGHFRRPDDFQKIYGLEKSEFERLRPFIFIETESTNQPRTSSDGTGYAAVAAPFLFDPNKALEGDFLKLGLPKRTARSILNYREKGGLFKKKSDFSKIYTLSPADFERLAPFIDLPETVEKAGSSSIAFQKNSTAQPTAFSPQKSFSKNPPSKIDANSATLEDWKSLPGIGDYFAQKIVRFRESLGGFSSLEQVAETRNLPDSAFQKMRPFLIFENPVFRKIRLNSASTEEFSKHPLLDRRAAEALVAYREHHGSFKKIEDLGAVRAISPALLKKLEAYLGLE